MNNHGTKNNATALNTAYLNQAQQQAVLQTNGPMLIVAGAGTGKTRVITERILYLLLQKNIPSSQILALTFTEKAAQEMIERVDIGMPLSYEEVMIKTFHGFCESILRQHGLEIGIDPGYKLLDLTRQWLFMKKNLFAFELDYYRPLGNPNKFLFTLLTHFSRLKDEDISPENYLEYARKLAKKATGENINASDANRAKKSKAEASKNSKEKALKAAELAKAYGAYQKLMMEQNCLDFGDLQYYALRLLEHHSSILNELQERYRYILVDEFQDTNFAQNKLIMLLANKYRNITVVGDDDQSIYKWRGASLSNILNFKKTFQQAAQVVLTENYRSLQPILDLSYKVIQNNNPYRLEAEEKIDKRLIAKRSEQKPPPKLLYFSSCFEEAQKIAATIDELVSAKNYHYEDFAILVRANNIAKPFVEALKSAQIPFVTRASEALRNFEEIKDLLSLLRFLRNPYDDVATFRLLCIPIFNLRMRDVLDLVAQAKKANFEPIFKFLRSLLKKDELQASLPGITPMSEKNMAFEYVYNFFDQMLEFSRQQKPSRIMGEFLDKSGYFKKLTENQTVKNTESIQRLAEFLKMAERFENEETDQSLRAFLDYLELLEDAAIPIESMQMAEHDAVSILSVHSAKGLEFPVVFLPSLVNQRFPATNRGEQLEVPRELVLEELPEKDMHLAEERRLFYVACTRAKDLLFLSYSDYYEGRKKWKVSRFLQEAGIDIVSKPHSDLDSGTNTNLDEKGVKTDFTQKAMKELGIPAPSTKENLFFIPEININNLSYSQLDAFHTCPFKYKFRYLFKIPSPSPHAANFGSSIHNTLNDFYQNIKNGEKPTMELMSKCYEKNWIAEGFESRAHENARKKQGIEILQKFYEKESKPQFIIPAYLERNFRLKIGKFTFIGRIDRIDRLPDGSYEVIDYKTGASKRNTNLKKDLQLSLYALACSEIFKLNISALSLYFLEDTAKVTTTRDHSEFEEVKNELERMSLELQKSDFMPTPGHYCRFCEYRTLCYAAQ